MDERLRILKMVEEGTITAEQAAELMAAMNIDLPVQPAAVTKCSYDKKFISTGLHYFISFYYCRLCCCGNCINQTE